MMLKITKIQESRRDVLIKLEGKITDQWAVLLDDECRSYLRQEKTVYLDCSYVDFIDARGVEVLNNFPNHKSPLWALQFLSRSCYELETGHERRRQHLYRVHWSQPIDQSVVDGAQVARAHENGGPTPCEAQAW